MRLRWFVLLGLAACSGSRFTAASTDGGKGRDGAADTGSNTDGVHCGSAGVCNVGEVCCWANAGDPGTASCVSPGTCSSAYKYACDESADCAALNGPGWQCCANVGNGVIFNSACAPQCQADQSIQCLLGTTPDPCGDAGSCMQAAAPTAYGMCQ